MCSMLPCGTALAVMRFFFQFLLMFGAKGIVSSMSSSSSSFSSSSYSFFFIPCINNESTQTEWSTTPEYLVSMCCFTHNAMEGNYYAQLFCYIILFYLRWD